MEFLPLEIQFKIFNLLDGESLINLREVSKSIKGAVEDFEEYYKPWKRICNEEIEDIRCFQNLLSLVDNHSNGLSSRFEEKYETIYELWMKLKEFQYHDCKITRFNKIVRRIYEVKSHGEYIFCIHSKEILIFDRNGDLLHNHQITKQIRVPANCYKTFLVSFKSKEELEFMQEFLTSEHLNSIDLEVIDFIKCCTLAFCFILYKNTKEVNDVYERIAFLCCLSPALRKTVNAGWLEKILKGFHVLDIEIIPNGDLLLIDKTGEIFSIDFSNNYWMKQVKNYFYIIDHGLNVIKGSHGIRWIYEKNNLYKVSSLLLYTNLLILGSKSGDLYIYYIKNLYDLDLNNCTWHEKLADNSIEHLDVCLMGPDLVILAGTSRKIFQIYFENVLK